MTSLFDFSNLAAGRGNDMPVDLVATVRRGVSLLEFFTVEEDTLPRVEVAEPVQPTVDFVASERAMQTHAMLDAAREEAKAEARREFDASLTEEVEAERHRVDKVCGEFTRDRQRYFAAAEAQVVKLALAIAKRVLAREVAADPMHLTAIVRAALARVHDGSETTLRVRPEDTERWAQTFAKACDGGVSVLGDERLGEGECALETDVGRVELGVDVQLGEIERGFGQLTQRQGE